MTTRAQWALLTDYLLQLDQDQVTLSWAELANIVGPMPASATNHPAWWSGDRPHARTWHRAGFAAGSVQPGHSVVFRRQTSETTAPPPTGVTARAGPHRTSASSLPAPEANADPPARALASISPSDALVIVPCSASKRSGGQPSSPSHANSRWPTELQHARERLRQAAAVDDSRLLPAVERYAGHFYVNAGSGLRDLADDSRLLILSGGYGVLEGDEPMGDYNQIMNLPDWPPGLLQQLLVARSDTAGRDVICFLARTTHYARLVQAVYWQLPPDRRVLLVTCDGVRGTSEVSKRSVRHSTPGGQDSLLHAHPGS